MQLGHIPNNTVHLSDLSTVAPTNTGTLNPNTPLPELPEDIVTPFPSVDFTWQKISYCPKTYIMEGKTGKVLCRVMPNKTARIWLDRLQYIAFVTSAQYAVLTAHIEGIVVQTDRNELFLLKTEESQRITFAEYFDIINWKKGNSVTSLEVELGFNFDGEIPDTPAPVIPTPDIPDTPTPIISTPPTPDTPSPSIPTIAAINNNFKLLAEDE